MPRSDSRPSTWRSDKRYQTYIITVRRIILGDELKYRNGFIFRQGYGPPPLSSSQFALTLPTMVQIMASGIGVILLPQITVDPGIASSRNIRAIPLERPVLHRVSLVRRATRSARVLEFGKLAKLLQGLQ